MINHGQTLKGSNIQICLVCAMQMNTNQTWSKLRLELDTNTYVTTLKYINPINIKWKRH
jgi:hypothetical protein